MIPKVAKLGTGFVGAGLYYMHDKREEHAQVRAKTRPTAAEYFLSDKGPAQSADRVGFTATRNLPTNDPMTALRHMAFTAAHAHDIRVAAVAASAKAAGLSFDDYVKQANPFRGRKGGKPVYSVSLSFEPGDPNATKANMLKAADEVRHVLGMPDHQCLIVEHTDTKHPHVHLIINRVHPTTGKFAKLSNDRLKLSEWALEWERRHGKIVCPRRSENWKKRDRNTATKKTARTAGDQTVKAGYVRGKGLPPSEIDFWNRHGGPDLRAVRAARANYQDRDYAAWKRKYALRLERVELRYVSVHGKTLARIDRALDRLRGKRPKSTRPSSHGTASLVFAAVRGAAHGVVARIAHRSDIAKLSKLRRDIVRERDVRYSEALKDRKAALEKMKRIHAWQNRLDERRCRNYRDSDTREWRDRRDRWDLSKVKPPLFGSVDMTFYDVTESTDWRRAADDRLALGEPLNMELVSDRLPYIPRDTQHHQAKIAADAKRTAKQRREKTKHRSAGRKRKPRPRRPD